MFSFFLKGGPVMWPMLLVSVATLSVVIERLLFLWREQKLRQPQVVAKILRAVEGGGMEDAIHIGEASKDYVAATLVYGLRHRRRAFAQALMQEADIQLKRFSRGLPVLDTAITLAPLLGLLGTVTGMIHAFGLLGHQELNSPMVITGGIAQALIATACGLGIAIIALIPFNYLNTRLEEARHAIENASTHLELLIYPEKRP